jgi:hypothetical protein
MTSATKRFLPGAQSLHIEVRLMDETVWLSQKVMAALFQKGCWDN